ncbi:DUF2842 domain-containing protein [Limibaculum sp. FT325]|uniref:DUF2842 domain-containing protein n=1 Tax=Thermohalobaculum sediminis TaxID=2939436 RepID=UPI0020BF53C2|nr:DUF2842 domain-containing protein [Limibaculum sediminis]MCL5777167.1 DUF2842 domain-containing protein [Limibaculum sediminis]
MTYRTRKRLAIAILVLGLPAYVVVALSVVGMFERPPLALEFAIYVGLGVLWAIPFRRVFLGLGRPDPDGGSDAGGPGHGGGGA